VAGDLLHYEDVEIGDDIGPVERTVTGEQVREFVGIWVPGRDTSRFTQEETAREHGQPAPIVPGAMSMAVVSQLLTGWSSTVTLRKLDVIFRQMVLHNTPLSVGGVVTDKRLTDGNPEVECDVFIDDVQGNRLVMGQALVTLPRGGP
jgi:acyl dehydratase